MSKICKIINFPQKYHIWNFSNIGPRIFKQRLFSLIYVKILETFVPESSLWIDSFANSECSKLMQNALFVSFLHDSTVPSNLVNFFDLFFENPSWKSCIFWSYRSLNTEPLIDRTRIMHFCFYLFKTFKSSEVTKSLVGTCLWMGCWSKIICVSSQPRKFFWNIQNFAHVSRK